MENLFFELIQVAIGTRDCLTRQPSTEEWYALFEMAKKQSLVGICFVGVQKLYNANVNPNANHSNSTNLSKLLYLTWMGLAAKIQQRNETVNKQCVELQKKLNCDGHRNYIMKGQAVASLYRLYGNEDDNDNQNENRNHSNASNTLNISQLRQSGDIDVYIEGGHDKVLEYALTFGETTKVNELEMSVNVFPDTEVEFHYCPFIMRSPFRNRKLQRFFKECEELNFNNKVSLSSREFQKVSDGFLEITAPTIEFNLVHQMVHIYHHLFTEGVGMRQLMDYYFVLRAANKEVLDGFNVFQRVSVVVKDLGLETFASALVWVIAHVFANDSHNENYPWIPNQRDGEFLLKEIMQSGNFGKRDERQTGLYDSKWNSFWIVNGKSFRLARFDRWMWFWGPIWRIYHFCWRKVNGFK